MARLSSSTDFNAVLPSATTAAGWIFASSASSQVFDGIGDVNVFAADAGLLQRAVQQIAGRPNKRVTLQVFLVARLFPHQHDAEAFSPFAGHGLRGIGIQGTAAARIEARRLLVGIDGDGRCGRCIGRHLVGRMMFGHTAILRRRAPDSARLDGSPANRPFTHYFCSSSYSARRFCCAGTSCSRLDTANWSRRWPSCRP